MIITDNVSLLHSVAYREPNSKFKLSKALLFLLGHQFCYTLCSGWLVSFLSTCRNVYDTHDKAFSSKPRHAESGHKVWNRYGYFVRLWPFLVFVLFSLPWRQEEEKEPTFTQKRTQPLISSGLSKSIPSHRDSFKKKGKCHWHSIINSLQQLEANNSFSGGQES